MLKAWFPINVFANFVGGKCPDVPLSSYFLICQCVLILHPLISLFDLVLEILSKKRVQVYTSLFNNCRVYVMSRIHSSLQLFPCDPSVLLDHHCYSMVLLPPLVSILLLVYSNSLFKNIFLSLTCPNLPLQQQKPYEYT